LAGFSSKNRPISRFVGQIEDHLYVLLNAVGPLGFAIFLTFVPSWWQSNSYVPVTDIASFFGLLGFMIWNPITGSVIFFLITSIGAIGQAKDTKALRTEINEKERTISNKESHIEELKSNNENLDSIIRTEVENNYVLAEELVTSYKKLAHLWICQIFNELKLNVKHRISIYYLNSDKDNMVLLDRFAKHHDYNMPGRPFFPRDQGVIGRVWAEGEFFERKIPIFNRKNTNYYQYLETTYGFSRDISSRLKMKSCTIGGFAIEDVDGHHVGVIIFESQDQNDFNIDSLRELIKRENHRLVDFISDTSLRDIRPLPSQPENREGAHDEQKAA